MHQWAKRLENEYIKFDDSINCIPKCVFQISDRSNILYQYHHSNAIYIYILQLYTLCVYHNPNMDNILIEYQFCQPKVVEKDSVVEGQVAHQLSANSRNVEMFLCLDKPPRETD